MRIAKPTSEEISKLKELRGKVGSCSSAYDLARRDLSEYREQLDDKYFGEINEYACLDETETYLYTTS